MSATVGGDISCVWKYENMTCNFLLTPINVYMLSRTLHSWDRKFCHLSTDSFKSKHCYYYVTLQMANAI